jgi:hypothetical protein
VNGNSPARSIGISGDGRVVATGDSAGQVTVWDATTGRVRLTLMQATPVDAVALTDDGAGVITLAGERISAARGDVPSTPITRVLGQDARGDIGFAMPQFNSRFAGAAPRPRVTVSRDGTRALVVDGRTARLTFWPMLLPPRTPVVSASVPPAATSASVPRWTGRVQGRSVEVELQGGGPRYSFTPQGSLGGTADEPTDFLFAPDSSAIAVWVTTSTQWNMGVWRLSDGKELQRMGSAGDLLCLALAPRASAVGWCRTRFTPDIVPLPPEAVSFADPSGSIRTLPVPTRAAVDTSDSGGFHFVRGMVFSPDAQLVLIWGDYLDAVIARIDGTGTPMVLAPHAARITSGAFSPDGRTVVLTSADGDTRTHPVAFDLLVQALASRVTSCLLPAQRVQYLAESDSTARARFLTCEAKRKNADTSSTR